MAIAEDLDFVTSGGASLSVIRDSVTHEDYVQWTSPSGKLYGITSNNEGLRKFLRKALARLEKTKQ